MKKIVILALHLGVGGIERVITNISNLLCENYDVTIISTYKLDKTPGFDINGKVKIKYLMEDLTPNKEDLKNAVKSHNILQFFKQGFISAKILYLRKKLMINAIKKIDADIIISTRILHNKLLGKYAKKGIVKIAQEHNHHNNNKKYIHKIIKSLKNIDYFMPVSNELANFYSGLLMDKKTKVVYIPNFINNDSKIISKLDKKVIVSVGRLEQVKGFLDLIEVFKIVNKKHPDWQLKIAGSGSQKDELQHKIENENLENNIELLGSKTKNELTELYLNSSIYVMTSFSESFGLVLIEAENCGLPLIAFDSAQGANEIIQNNKNGILIPNRNKTKMANAIIELIENKGLRENIGKQGKEMSKPYCKQTVSKQWNEFINNI